MLFRVIVAGGPFAETVVRRTALLAGPSDHMDVQLLLDLRWLEPPLPTADYYSAPYVPSEPDAATLALRQELDEKLEVYRLICAESPATFAVTRRLGMPETAITRGAADAGVLVLPHPDMAAPELRRAVRRTVLFPPCPVLVVACPTAPSGGVVVAEDGRGLDETTCAVAARLLEDRVSNLSVAEDLPLERMQDWAPVVDRIPAAEAMVPPAGVLQVVIGPARPACWRRRSVAESRLVPLRDLLLIPR